MKRVIIIGGGASGLAAAIKLAQGGFDVTILEREEKCGKKILASGGGRCNFSNALATKYNYKNPEYVQGIFNICNASNVLEFFKSIGLLFYHDSEGRYYPVSNHSSSVLNCLLEACKAYGVKIKNNNEVTEVKKKGSKFIITSNINYEADFCIISAGGGSLLAKGLGHSIVPFKPSLVGIKCKDKFFQKLDGIRIAAEVILANDGTEYREKGEVQFKKDGISGICVMNLSAKLARAKQENVKISLDLLPEIEKPELYKILKTRPSYLKRKKSYAGIFGQNLGEVLSELCKDLDIKETVDLIKEFRLEYVCTYPTGQVISGGVDVNELNLTESKLINNLHFTGEIIDVDGDCGGFNLLFAWASGITASKKITS